MAVRGIRGATTVASNTKQEITEKTREMLETLVRLNDVRVEDVVSAIFSVTDDLDAEFPAVAARKLGWVYTPLFCTLEIPVPGSLRSCIRGADTRQLGTAAGRDEARLSPRSEKAQARPGIGQRGQILHVG